MTHHSIAKAHYLHQSYFSHRIECIKNLFKTDSKGIWTFFRPRQVLFNTKTNINYRIQFFWDLTPRKLQKHANIYHISLQCAKYILITRQQCIFLHNSTLMSIPLFKKGTFLLSFISGNRGRRFGHKCEWSITNALKVSHLFFSKKSKKKSPAFIALLF